jgi:hypothetical protein
MLGPEFRFMEAHQGLSRIPGWVRVVFLVAELAGSGRDLFREKPLCSCGVTGSENEALLPSVVARPVFTGCTVLDFERLCCKPMVSKWLCPSLALGRGTTW